MSLRTRLLGDRDEGAKLLWEGKRLLGILKNDMLFNKLDQLSRPHYLADNSVIFVQSVFGQDLIQITVPKVSVAVSKVIIAETSTDLIFLFFNSTEYAVWEIKDDGSLEPYFFKLEEVVIEWFPFSSGYRYPSVNKSNDDWSKHYSSIETRTADVATISPNYIQVGRTPIIDAWETLINIPNGWRQPDWNSNSEKVFDSDESDYDTYVCSSRNRDYLDTDGSIIKDLRLIKVTSTTGDITYTKEGGDFIGATIGYQSERDIYAVLSKDKFIGVDKNTFTEIPYFYSSVVTYDPDCVSLPFPTRTILQEQGQEYSFLFGDVVIEKYLGFWRTWIGSPIAIGCGSCTKDEPFRLTKLFRIEYVSGNSSLMVILDYSNIEVDKTFICFYSKHDGYGIDYAYNYRSGNTESGTTVAYNGYRVYGGAIKKIYYLVYRINNGSLKKVEISNIRNGDYTYWGSPNWGAPCSTPGTTETNVVGFQGERITRISTSISDKYILYSYTSQKYIGLLSQPHFNDTDDDDWEFQYRILGVINIETGKRTEHEGNDSFLGDLYKDKFDIEKAAAIGLHKLVQEVTI